LLLLLSSFFFFLLLSSSFFFFLLLSSSFFFFLLRALRLFVVIMIIDDQYYDIIIIGTGAGGGTLVHKLAPTGKKILVLERGNFSSPENKNLNDTEIFKRERYHAPEQWYDNAGEPFHPQANYSVGGNTKIYSGALLRMREQDFEEVKHQEGISSEWPLKYRDFEPYYTEAEKLYRVHGKQGDDPTEPYRSEEYPHPPVNHESQILSICDRISKQGLHPAHLPLGFQENEVKTDAEVTGIVPALSYPNVTLKTDAKAVCLHTNPSGVEVKAVQVEIGEQSYLFFADIFVVACGAVKSAALLLRSANDLHPKGIANSSDQVGRNFMKQQMTAVVQLTPTVNSGLFQRTLYVNDFYWGYGDYPYPMGHIQNSGGLLQDAIFAESPPILSILAKLMPGFGLRQLATRSIGWWLQTEDLPTANNRVRVVGSKLYLDYTPNNTEAHDRLVYRWQDVLKAVDSNTSGTVLSRNIHPRGEVPIQVVAHQCGTCRFGLNSATSVLDLNCRTHDVGNLYVVDGSFFPSSSAVSPALTIMANALRVGEHLIERLG
jgi:choline dehydrogenase-like flavoprotein